MTNTYEAIKELIDGKHELEYYIQVAITKEVTDFYKQFGVGIKNISVPMIDTSSLDERNQYLVGQVEVKLAIDD